ncbi:PREDICTED: cytochrome c6, chloroplastic isoform X3 [Lupinus angustifolius]|uniref:cytochrome c6, chloroplastic isoform X3 n=1 Tax=Lupinus angustifolius TaxID=3871 RepID=UPI00092E2623|nr:PREDICTED: cytochrome c6, chloroplastic isoform X3 [Lupinus angustifolius]
MKLACMISNCTGYIPHLSIKVNVKREENSISIKAKEVKFFKTLAPPLVAAFLVLSPFCSTPVSIGQTIDIHKGATLFGQACIGCHDAGGNIIQPGATLSTKDLQSRNGVDTEEDIYSITYNGKGRMPVSYLAYTNDELFMYYLNEFFILWLGEECVIYIVKCM